MLLLGAAVCILLSFGYVFYLMLQTPDVEVLGNARHQQSTIVYSSEGHQIARFYRQNRTWVPIDSVAPVVVNALVDTEDRRFYQHSGIDILRTLGAIFKTIGGDRQGGSTLTMQLVRNAYPEIADDPALIRKVKEWFTALEIERAYNKREILEIYLNTVPFNYSAFGIEAAARTYFNTSAYRLDTLQAATLVGMLKGTTLYNPVRNPDASQERRNVVLQQMMEAGNLSPNAYRELRERETELNFSPFTSEKNRAPYFAEHVRNWLRAWASEAGYDIYKDGFRVYTTLDMELQQKAETVVREELDKLQAVVDVSWSQRNIPIVSSDPDAYLRYQSEVEPFAYYWEANPDALNEFIKQTARYKQLVKQQDLHADQALERLRQDTAFVDSLKMSMTRLQTGFVAMDPNNGHVKAWIGGRSFEHDKYDHVALAKRQPGSTFKPFVYAAALEKGYAPGDQLPDEKVSYVDPVTGKRWEPGNFAGESGRIMTLQEGLTYSKNTITAQLIIDVGPEQVARLARRAGIESDLDAVPSLALGTSVVTLLEMAAAYSTLANHGRYQKPVFITRIEDREGNVVAQFEPESKEAIQPSTAYTVLDMMRNVIDKGTGVRMRNRYGAQGDLAGKTGTTQHAADGWFMLMHPNLVMGAWVGFPSPAVTFRTQYWGQGSHNALRLVGRFYQEAGLPTNASFSPPPGYTPPAPSGRLLAVGDEDEDEDNRARADTQRQQRPSRTRTRPQSAENSPGRSDSVPPHRTEEEAQEKAQAEPSPPPSTRPTEKADPETARLNRQEQQSSKVGDYLEQLRKEKRGGEQGNE